MGKYKDVGRSVRTPGKHKALDSYLAMTAGVISRSFSSQRHVWIDCTAGDGVGKDFSRDTSAGIILRHAKWLKDRGIRIEVHLFERAEQAYVSLLAHVLNSIDGDVPCTIHNQNAQNMPKLWQDGDVLFVVIDPNTINDWVLPNALETAPKFTTIFSTLGCNVGGLKRMSYAHRQQWYTHLQAQIDLLKHHDAYLVALDGDSAQWAYLVNAPQVWRHRVENIFRSAFAYGWTVTGSWHKRDPQQFGSLVDRLFLRRDEL